MTAESSITLNVPAAKVWEALVTPEIIAQYLYGTKVETDWKVGSTIYYRGEWEGNAYEDKGIITALEEGTLLETEYWSSLSGTPDSREHYIRVSYLVGEEQGQSTLTILQEGCQTEEDRTKKEADWAMVLSGIKTLLER